MIVGAVDREVNCDIRRDRVEHKMHVSGLIPVLDLQLTGDHYVGKPSAGDQPTRPTQPFILSGSIDE